MPVIDADTGRTYGTLKEVTNRGAQDLYVVDMGEGKEAYVPAVSQFVKEISLEKGIFITPIEGMLE